MFLHFFTRTLHHKKRRRHWKDISKHNSQFTKLISFLSPLVRYIYGYFCTSASVKTVRCDLFDEGSSDRVLLAQSSSLYPQ